MAQQNIAVGSAVNDGTGDSLRAAGMKVNANFTELYTRAPGGLSGMLAADNATGNYRVAVIADISFAGIANGLATLDGSGKVPTSQLPAAVLGALKYQGTWNAATNSPALATGVGTLGFYYVVGTAGTTTIDGVSSWSLGDWITFDGTKWDKIDNNNLVASVVGLTGAVTGAALKTALAIAYADVSGLGTAAQKTAGTAAGNVLLLSVANQLPAMDASLLTGLPGAQGGFLNKFYNAPLDVWQFGTTGTVTAGASSMTADGWYVGCTGANVTWSQQGGRLLTRNSLRATGAASVTDILFKQRIEGMIAAAFANQSVTIQAEIYNNSGGSFTPTITVKRATGEDSWSGVATDVSAVALQACANGVWTKVSYTFTANAASANGLEFTIDCGNNFNGAGKWVQICEMDIRAATAVQPPELRPVHIEYDFCMRYYESVYVGFVQHFVANANLFGFSAGYKVPKRVDVVPTLVSGTVTGALSIYVHTALGGAFYITNNTGLDANVSGTNLLFSVNASL